MLNPTAAKLAKVVMSGSTAPHEIARAALGYDELPLAPTPYTTVYAKDEVRLLRYTPEKQRYSTPILFVYSLINRYTILDFMPGRSLIAFMLDQGYPVYCIDWGTPGEDEEDRDWNDYLGRYLRRCVRKTLADSGADSLSLYGYCMGGTMALAYLSLYPEGVRNFIAQATPVDFHNGGILATWTRPEYFNVDALVDAYGNVPTDMMESAFRSMDPVGTAQKWQAFADRIDDKDFVELFLSMETWAADNIPFPGELYRQYIKDCYQTNNLMHGKMIVGDRRVDLGNITCPLLNLMATKDTIAPPDSSKVLRTLTNVEDYTELEFPCGHIGISTSSKGPRLYWPQVAEWLSQRSVTLA